MNLKRWVRVLRSASGCRWIIFMLVVVSGASIGSQHVATYLVEQQAATARALHLERLRWQRRVARLQDGTSQGRIAQLSASDVQMTQAEKMSELKVLLALRLQKLATPKGNISQAAGAEYFNTSDASLNHLRFTFRDIAAMSTQDVVALGVAANIEGVVSHAAEMTTLLRELEVSSLKHPMEVRHCRLRRQEKDISSGAEMGNWVNASLQFNCQVVWYLMSLEQQASSARLIR